MTTITESHIELTSLDATRLSSNPNPATTDAQLASDSPPEDAYSTTVVPDGGYGWTIVFCCAVTIFWNTGILNCWGVMQAALLNSNLQHVSASTLSWVGSLGLAGGAAYGLLATRIIRMLGSRITAILGVAIMGFSLIGSGLSTSNVAGLFGTAGVTAGAGMALVYSVSNALPVQYFSGRLGLANGLVKLGGGIGGCVLAVALDALNRRVGIEWTFIIQGMVEKCK